MTYLCITMTHIVNLIGNWKVWGHYAATVSIQIRPWLDENCIGEYLQLSDTYMWRFEKLEDAIAFRLRWDVPGH